MRLVYAFSLTLALGCTGNGNVTTGTTSTAGSGGAPASGAGGAGGAASTSVGAGGAASTSVGAGGAAACPMCAAPEIKGKLDDAALAEISGIAASAVHADVFFVNNDSGDSARFFAIDGTGHRLATYKVGGATAVDWEDIERGPCPQNSCVYIGDIGDNAESRVTYTVYRVPEPATVADATVTAEALPFTYPDGSHNAETLLVHPVTGKIVIVTKVSAGASSIYEFPLPLTPGSSVVLSKVGQVKANAGDARFTGGDVHPKGAGVLLRTYTNIFYYAMSKGSSIAEALAGAPCTLPAPSEPQGEAVGWLSSGSGYVTVSEGVGANVYRIACP